MMLSLNAVDAKTKGTSQHSDFIGEGAEAQGGNLAQQQEGRAPACRCGLVCLSFFALLQACGIFLCSLLAKNSYYVLKL